MKRATKWQENAFAKTQTNKPAHGPPNLADGRQLSNW